MIELLGAGCSGKRAAVIAAVGADRPYSHIVCAPDSLEIAVEPKRILLVGSEKAEKVNDCLRRANCLVVKARDGESALVFAKHMAFDAFVLVSTGDFMGRTETALNLRDIRPFSEVILVAREPGKPTQGEAAAMAIPNTRVLTIQELPHHFASSGL